MENAYATFAELLKSRRSVKKYQKDVLISRAELEEMLSLASTAPSSWNLQHWRYLVITEQETKERLLPIAYHQRQVVESSATIVLLGDLEANKASADVYEPELSAGVLSQKVYDTLVHQIDGAYHNAALGRDEAILNASLAGMQLMLVAAAKGYGTCPMGGFDAEALIRELGIPARYLPVMLITIGKEASPARVTSRLSIESRTIYEGFSNEEI